MDKTFKNELSGAELVEKYSAMIYRLAYARLQNISDAEDVTQEVLLKYIRSGKTFNDEEHRKAWILKVTVNTIKTMATLAFRRHDVALEEAADMSYLPQESSGIGEAIRQLPEKYRTVIHLFYFEDLSVNEIAKITGKTAGTVKSQLSRAREKLKELLSEDEQYV